MKKICFYYFASLNFKFEITSCSPCQNSKQDALLATVMAYFLFLHAKIYNGYLAELLQDCVLMSIHNMLIWRNKSKIFLNMLFICSSTLYNYKWAISWKKLSSGPMPTVKALIRLCICTVWSGPLLSSYNRIYWHIARVHIRLCHFPRQARPSLLGYTPPPNPPKAPFLMAWFK